MQWRPYRPAWQIVSATAFSLVAAMPLGAQWRADALVGAAQVTQPDSPGGAAATAAASLAWLRGPAAVGGSAAVTVPDGGARRMHGELTGSLRSDARRRLGIEATGAVSAYDETSFPRVLSGMAGVRMRARGAGMELWGGVSAGTLHDGTFTYPHTALEGGLLAGWRFAWLGAGITGNRTIGEPRIEFVGDPPLQVTVRDDLRYVDAVLTARARLGRLDVDGRLGTRSVQRTIGYEALPPDRLFGDVSASWDVTSHVAVAASLGHVLADLARGIPEARYATLGLRVRLYASTPPVRRPVNGRGVPSVPGAAPDVMIEHRDGAATLRVLASPSARTIEVAGTFTDWEPQRLGADGAGFWSLATPVAPGRHRIMVRVDNGVWSAPANLPSVDDEVGGRVGLFTVIEPI